MQNLHTQRFPKTHVYDFSNETKIKLREFERMENSFHESFLSFFVLFTHLLSVLLSV